MTGISQDIDCGVACRALRRRRRSHECTPNIIFPARHRHRTDSSYVNLFISIQSQVTAIRYRHATSQMATALSIIYVPWTRHRSPSISCVSCFNEIFILSAVHKNYMSPALKFAFSKLSFYKLIPFCLKKCVHVLVGTGRFPCDLTEWISLRAYTDVPGCGDGICRLRAHKAVEHWLLIAS